MGNVIDFPVPEIEGVFYRMDANNSLEGISVTGSPVDFVVIDGKPMLDAGSEDGDIRYEFKDRESAAKFFWACAYYLDSEERHCADKYVCLNYDDKEGE